MGTSPDPKKSAVREAEEEIGLSIDPDELMPISESAVGWQNLLKVWQYGDQSIIQMGSNGACFGFTPGSVPLRVQLYIEALDLLDFHGQDQPHGLELQTYNREYCFYYLHFPTIKAMEEAKNKVIDGEAKDLQEVNLATFLNTPRCERTDSTETLIVNCPSLNEIIYNKLLKGETK